jgi:hypothetical protein
MRDIKIFNPVELSKPRSPYMQVAWVKTSEFAFIAGRVSVDASRQATEQSSAPPRLGSKLRMPYLW